MNKTRCMGVVEYYAATKKEKPLSAICKDLHHPPLVEKLGENHNPHNGDQTLSDLAPFDGTFLLSQPPFQPRWPSLWLLHCPRTFALAIPTTCNVLPQLYT